MLLRDTIVLYYGHMSESTVNMLKYVLRTTSSAAERFVHIEEVVGSIPTSSTNEKQNYFRG